MRRRTMRRGSMMRRTSSASVSHPGGQPGCGSRDLELQHRVPRGAGRGVIHAQGEDSSVGPLR
eukprot:46484-Pyramimonas_sp.AAC.1